MIADVGPAGRAKSRGFEAEVAQLRQRVEQLDALAHQDSLSDLPNRRGFMRELERMIDRVKRYDEQAAMLFVDLDGLKMINDSFGHCAGDEALIQVARLAGRRRPQERPGARESAATSSRSCSYMPTRKVRIETAVAAGRPDRRLRLPSRWRAAAAQRRHRRRHDRAPRIRRRRAIARADAEMYRRKRCLT